MLLKNIILITLLSTLGFATNLTLKTKEVINAQTALLLLEGANISKPKLTLMNKKKFNVNFYENPFKANVFYALVPISYYEVFKQHKIIISYIKNEKKVFKSVKLTVKEGNYKSETITVKPSKVKPNKTQQKRTRKEYKEAMDIYKIKSPKILWEKDFIYPMNTKNYQPLWNQASL